MPVLYQLFGKCHLKQVVVIATPIGLIDESQNIVTAVVKGFFSKINILEDKF